MAALKHNKKRNVGLVQEFLARFVAASLAEGGHQHDKKMKMLELVGKHFKPGSELHRESMIFRSLLSTRVNSKEAAASLIGQAKKACRSLDETTLERSKTTLIHDINHKLQDDKFWDRSVNSYKLCATIQVLMNEWKKDVITESLQSTTELEDQLLTHLTRSPETKASDNVKMVETSDPLITKLMIERFNTKYGSVLNENQKKLVSLYLLAQETPEKDKEFRTFLNKLGETVLFRMEKYASTQNPDKYLQEKLNETREFIELTAQTVTEQLNDDILAVYLNLAKLDEELA
jgi:hypothetical protein